MLPYEFWDTFGLLTFKYDIFMIKYLIIQDPDAVCVIS